MVAFKRHVIPHLDVHSRSLVYISGVSTHLHWRDLKLAISKATDSVNFVETFEAWFGKRFGHIIIDFRTVNGMKLFLTDVPPSWLKLNFQGEPKIEADRRHKSAEEFFRVVKRNTKIDLLASDGKPPQRWLEKKAEHPRNSGRYPRDRQGRNSTRRGRFAITPIDFDAVENDNDYDGRGGASKCYVVVENLPNDCTRSDLERYLDLARPLSIEVCEAEGGESASLFAIIAYYDMNKAVFSQFLLKDEKLGSHVLKARITNSLRDAKRVGRAESETTPISTPSSPSRESGGASEKGAGRHAHTRILFPEEPPVATIVELAVEEENVEDDVIMEEDSLALSLIEH